MIDRGHELSLKRQAELLRLSRSGLYYRPRPAPAADLAVMRRLDELHLEAPFADSRMLRDMLRADGVEIGRGRVATLMRRIGISALYRPPNTSKPAPGHRIYPYLLRGVTVDRPNMAWAMDITYIPMARGFVYLAAAVDWFSRRVLSWRLSITQDTGFCVEAVEEALARHGRPAIFNTDQGSQGGFKRSSQHFGKGGCDEYSKATFGPVRAGAIAVTWSAAGGGTCRPAAVLVCDRGR